MEYRPSSFPYDPGAPRRSTLCAFEAMQDPPATAPRPGTPPPELLAAPRALPLGAPALTTEVPAGIRWLLVLGALLFGVGPLLFAALSSRPGEGAVALMVGELVFLLLVAFAAPQYVSLVTRPRAILRRGEPLAAVVTHVAGDDAARVWISFVAPADGGALRGRASLRRERVRRMGAAPQTGDTIFLVANRARAWERVIWGFSGGRAAERVAPLRRSGLSSPGSIESIDSSEPPEAPP